MGYVNVDLFTLYTKYTQFSSMLTNKSTVYRMNSIVSEFDGCMEIYIGNYDNVYYKYTIKYTK